MLRTLLFIAALAASNQVGSAAVYIEDFEAAFPAWESGWFGANSNARNVYGVGGDRGNNPDGLWIQDDSPLDQNIRIVFNNAFALGLTSLSMDIAGFSGGLHLEFFDANGTVLSDVLVTLTAGAFSDPGVYANYSVTSGTGIGGFRFYGGTPEGNTSIDNIVADTDGQTVPEPLTWMMVLPALSMAVLHGRRKNRNGQ
ncbi:MAG: hypothetical protein U0R19_34385 [Bryobacteraceae bacterium]